MTYWNLSFSQIKTLDIYIHHGQVLMYDSIAIDVTSFNNIDSFQAKHLNLKYSVGDSLLISIYNRDSSSHQLCIPYLNWFSDTIKTGDSLNSSLKLNQSGFFVLKDVIHNHNVLDGSIQVGYNNNKSFYWNIRSFSSVNSLNPYRPDYFTLNTHSKPDIFYDSSAVPVANVGDTVLIFIANTGLSYHSLHFHGFHSEILFSSKFSNHSGRLKDTFPIYPKQSLILRMVPDKTGIYPVHDHNLLAVTGGGIYPNGMFISMKINGQ